LDVGISLLEPIVEWLEETKRHEPHPRARWPQAFVCWLLGIAFDLSLKPVVRFAPLVLVRHALRAKTIFDLLDFFTAKHSAAPGGLLVAVFAAG